MNASGIFSRALAFAAKNERKLGGLLFALGFLIDLLTFGSFPVETVNYFFLTYLVFAAVSALGAHYFAGAALSPSEPWWRRWLSVIFPLAVQYAFGGLLSGFFVFYAANSFLAVSWPFILVLAAIYFGNEYFRMYKHYLVFQATIFFFALYAYAIFGLPLLIGTIGPWTFLGSTLASLAAFAVFIWLLRLVNPRRLKEGMRHVVASVGAVVIVVSASYFSGLIPPIPLAVADSGVYHALERVPGGYRVLREESPPWWQLSAPVARVVPGAPLYAYSAVVAPVRFGTTVVHRWERHVSGTGWIIENRISFPVTGGREGGYRGYSLKTNLAPGKWRVSVETQGGQVIGRIRFDIERANTPPALIEETL